MKATELREKDDAALGKELTDLLKAQFGLRMQIATQQLSNTSQLKKVRRDIARVRTVMTQKATQALPQASVKQASIKTAAKKSPTKKAGQQ